MLHLIGKNLWARRYRNGWLLAELIIVSMGTDCPDCGDYPRQGAAYRYHGGRNVQTESCCCLFQISAF